MDSTSGRSAGSPSPVWSSPDSDPIPTLPICALEHSVRTFIKKDPRGQRSESQGCGACRGPDLHSGVFCRSRPSRRCFFPRRIARHHEDAFCDRQARLRRSSPSSGQPGARHSTSSRCRNSTRTPPLALMSESRRDLWQRTPPAPCRPGPQAVPSTWDARSGRPAARGPFVAARS